MEGSKPGSVLVLNLTAFSKTGGLEKFNRCFLKALSDIEKTKHVQVVSYSMYDAQSDERYFNSAYYKGFNGGRLSFVIKSILSSRHYDCIVLAHINIALVGYFVKLFFPKKKIILITHGIEVWGQLRGFKKKILKNADLILSVSSFTKSKLMNIQNVEEKRIALFYNTIDPFFPLPSTFSVNLKLRQRYGLGKEDFVLYTLTRLSSGEKYKGYDIVIKCLPDLLKTMPALKYVIAGKYDIGEKTRLDELIKRLSLEKVVIFTDYINESEVQAHFQMSDLFIMPSKGEGFGIVFIEAMACGLPVIAGNQDGSIDALQNGELGTLVNPNSEKEIAGAITTSYYEKLKWTTERKRQLQTDVLSHFSYNLYRERLEHIILSINSDSVDHRKPVYPSPVKMVAGK